MIFVTLGSQKFQFNRLIQKIDELCKLGIIDEEIFAQIGYSNYKPQHYKFKEFLDRDDFVDVMYKADFVITHAGTGAIIGALKANKKVLAVPRLKKYEEHIDDHQMEIVIQYDKMNLIEACYNIDDLEQAMKNLRRNEYGKYVSNTDKIVDDLIKYINSL